MSESEVTLYGDGMEVSIELDELADAMGEQYILGDEGNRSFGYLIALALECHDDGNYDVKRVLMEFMRNDPAFDNVPFDEFDRVQAILEQ